uniref:Deacetylase sirtuin-type domain-containing protein n=1 Tax=Romanomermis culicivorax TaxID=13658 RepID=A0A915HHK8_ROMCU
MIEKFKKIADFIRSGLCSKVIVMAGAGISTPSGLPDFRSKGGVFDQVMRNFDLPYPESVFDIFYFRRDPRIFFQLAKSLYPDVGIDPENLIEAHGSFATASCITCGTKYNAAEIKEQIFGDEIPKCRKCFSIVKPNIIFYGENLPRRFMLYLNDVQEASLLIVIGTSLEVYPFAAIADELPQDTPRLLLNQKKVGSFVTDPRENDVVIEGNHEREPNLFLIEMSGISTVLFCMSALSSSICSGMRYETLKALNSSLNRRPAKMNVDLDVWIYRDLIIYQNQNKTDMIETFENGQRLFGFLQKWSFWRSTKVNPFLDTYIGVETDKEYDIRLNVKCKLFQCDLFLDLWLTGIFILGLFLFVSAKKLSRNVMAFYVGGSSVGLLLSVLLVLFVIYRFLPHKRTVVLASALTGAASVNCYILFALWKNLFTILKNYQRYFAIYTITVSAFSFAVCYKFGPPKDMKSKNLIQWSIQVLGLVLVYYSCQIESIAYAVMVTTLFCYYCQNYVFYCLMRIRNRYFPPKLRFLTEEEYIEQGSVETQKALSALREYCRSPKCDAWNITSRLKSPMSGDSHLNDDELLNYDTFSPELKDDDDSSFSSTSSLNGDIFDSRLTKNFNSRSANRSAISINNLHGDNNRSFKFSSTPIDRPTTTNKNGRHFPDSANCVSNFDSQEKARVFRRRTTVMENRSFFSPSGRYYQDMIDK